MEIASTMEAFSIFLQCQALTSLRIKSPWRPAFVWIPEGTSVPRAWKNHLHQSIHITSNSHYAHHARKIHEMTKTYAQVFHPSKEDYRNKNMAVNMMTVRLSCSCFVLFLEMTEYNVCALNQNLYHVSDYVGSCQATLKYEIIYLRHS